MAKRRKTESGSFDAQNYDNLLNNIQRIITRPNLTQISYAQTHAIVVHFVRACLSPKELDLPPEAQRARYNEKIAALKLGEHDVALNGLLYVLSEAAETYAKENQNASSLRLSDTTPVFLHSPGARAHMWLEGWSTIEAAKTGEDPVAKDIAEKLQQAIYAVMPPVNNLKNPNNAVRRIDTRRRN